MGSIQIFLSIRLYEKVRRYCKRKSKQTKTCGSAVQSRIEQLDSKMKGLVAFAITKGNKMLSE